MPRFLIEVPHEAESSACIKVIQTFVTSGSHFLTHADWGCMDGDHTTWMIVEADSKEEARSILPLSLRPQARIVGLNKFTKEEMEQLLSSH